MENWIPVRKLFLGEYVILQLHHNALKQTINSLTEARQGLKQSMIWNDRVFMKSITYYIVVIYKHQIGRYVRKDQPMLQLFLSSNYFEIIQSL